MSTHPDPIRPRPLCVDLDGTLLRSDTLVESALALVKRNPLYALALLRWLAGGRARLKREVAERVGLDVAALPYDPDVLAHLRAERASGRSLVLATAADEILARAIADHLGIFDEVVASDGVRNLKGEAKRAALCDRFGAGGYEYVGNERADVAVWRDAHAGMSVGGTVPLGASSRVSPMAARPRRRLRAVLAAVRVHQWVKNLLVFVPIAMSHELTDPALFIRAAIAFMSFSLCASTVYLTNDLLDLDADRRHARKRTRPFASGDLPIAAGALLIPALLAASVALALLLPASFLATLGAYVVLTTLYSLALKHVALVDVIVLASLYTGRLMAGAAATGVWPTPWLLGFAMFFFLSLAFVKRYSELHALRGSRESLKVRGYYPADLEQIATLGAVSGYLSVLVAALYINTDRVVSLYAQPELLWLVCPLLLYWISRTWLLAHRGEMHDDPVVFAIRDRASYVVGALLAAVLILAAHGVR